MQWKHLKLKVCWSAVSLAERKWRPRAGGIRRCSASSSEIGDVEGLSGERGKC